MLHCRSADRRTASAAASTDLWRQSKKWGASGRIRINRPLRRHAGINKLSLYSRNDLSGTSPGAANLLNDPWARREALAKLVILEEMRDIYALTATW